VVIQMTVRLAVPLEEGDMLEILAAFDAGKARGMPTLAHGRDNDSTDGFFALATA